MVLRFIVPCFVPSDRFHTGTYHSLIVRSYIYYTVKAKAYCTGTIIIPGQVYPNNRVHKFYAPVEYSKSPLAVD